MSTEEEDRIDWLRNRGVIIDLPEERGKPINNSLDKSKFVNITVVLIPCKDIEPYREIEIAIDLNDKGDRLLKSLKPYFSPITDNLDEEALKETAKKQFSLTGQSLPTDLNIESLKKTMSNMGSVESFSLSHPQLSNNYCGINLYLDEIGQLKHLPSNNRARTLAASCGFDNVPLAGDMYIGRIRCIPNSSEGIINESFRLDELNSDSSWLMNIKKDNYEYGIKTNRVVMPGDIDDTPKTNEIVDKGIKWTESNENIEVIYQLSDNLTTKDIKIQFHSKSVIISLKSNPKEVLLNIDLYKSIQVDDCTWTGSKRDIEISLEKSNPGTWGQLEKS